METVQMEQTLIAALEPIRQRLIKLEQEQTQFREQMLNLKPSKLLPSGSPNGSRNNEHPHGLCGDDSCESCMGQTQEIINEAYLRGRADYADHLEKLWELRGGEALRANLVQATQEGQALWEQAELEAQEVKISA